MQSLEALRAALSEHETVLGRMVETQADILLKIADQLTHVLERGGTIYLCGNGGSAADAQHVAAEFVGRFLRERRPLPAHALTVNTSTLTAIGNDYDFSQVFARQVQAHVTPRDAVVGITTSGKSPNVLAALRVARQLGAAAVGFTGTPGEPLGEHCDVCLKVPTRHTPRIQEAHIFAWHFICDLVETRILGEQPGGLHPPYEEGASATGGAG